MVAATRRHRRFILAWRRDTAPVGRSSFTFQTGDHEVTPLRAAIYARYSSDSQRDTSLEDQERLCRQEAERQGCEVVAVWNDAAMSG